MALLRVGLVQYASRRERRESLEVLRGILSRHRVEADLVVLPEYADTTPVRPRREFLASGVSVEDNEFLAGLEGLAAEYSAYFVAGVLEKKGDCNYSSVALVEPSGGTRIIYRKRILFDALGYRESSLLCPGSEKSPIVELKGVKIGFAVCFELRFPEVFREIALSGAYLAVVPTAWYAGSLKEEQLITAVKARANEETMYIAAANQYSDRFTGRSMVVDPYAVKILDLGQGEKYGEAIVDTGVVEEAREKLPLLDIYKKSIMGRCA